MITEMRFRDKTRKKYKKNIIVRTRHIAQKKCSCGALKNTAETYIDIVKNKNLGKKEKNVAKTFAFVRFILYFCVAKVCKTN